MKYIALFSLLFTSIAYANSTPEEFFLSYGMGVMGNADYYAGQSKVINAGYRSFIWQGLYLQGKVGYFTEASPDPKRRASAYGSVGLGLEVATGPVEIRSGWGIGAISTPDSQLGGQFPQFNGEAYIGLRDKNGSGIGFQYEHLSSAGIIEPNRGRDFIVLQLSMKW